MRQAGRGQALVEFALFAPVLLLLLVITVDAGRLLVTWLVVNEAAREGAYVASTQAQAQATPADMAAAAAAAATAAGSDIGLQPADVCTAVASATPGPACASFPAPPTGVTTVQVSHPYQPITPVLRSLWAAVCPNGSCAVTARASFPLQPPPGPTPTFVPTPTTWPTRSLSIVPSTQTPTAGQPVDLTVTALDGWGNPATSYAGTVHFTSTGSAAGGLPADYTFTPSDNGVHTFRSAVRFTSVGTDTVTVTDTASGSSSRTNLTVQPGPPATLAFSAQPANAVAGATLAPVQAVVQDAYGNTVTGSTATVSLALGSQPAGAALGGTTTVQASGGVATWSDLFLNTAGDGYTLTAASAGLTSATSNPFSIGAATPTALAFQVQPPPVAAAGASLAPAVQVVVQDAYGNTVTSSAAEVTLALATNPTNTSLFGTAVVAASSGLASFADLSIQRVGTGYTLSASSPGLAGATSTAFDISPGSASTLVATSQPTTTTAGSPLSPALQVTVQDAYGNVVTTSGATISVGLGTGTGPLLGTTTLNAANGVVTFGDLSIDQAGQGYSLLATSSGLTPARTAAFDILPADPAGLAFVVQPGDAIAGASLVPAVQVVVQDAYGNTVTGSTAAVTLALGTNPSGGTLSGTTSVNATGGVATFSDLSIDKVGAGYTLVASSAGLPSATSTSFDITAAPANTLAFVVQPSNGTAGSALSPAIQVAVKDASGNTVTGSTAAVTLAIGTNPSGGTLSGTRTVNTTGGVATFSDLSIDKVGAGYTLSAFGSGLAGTTSASFSIAPGSAARLAFSVQPTDTTAGASISPSLQVTVQDAAGNTVTSSKASINLSISNNPGGGTLKGTTTATASNGVAVFPGLWIDKAGSGYSLSATATGLTRAISAAFSINPGPATRLAFTVQPSTTTAGVAMSPAIQVAVQDAYGNTVTSSTAAITVAIGTNPGGGSLSGTRTLAASSGVASFSTLSINKTGTGYTLVASSTGLTGATSAAFNVTPGAATRLVFSTQPSNTPIGTALSPAVRITVQDTYGNTVTGSPTSITVALGTNPSRGSLSGTRTVNATGGVASFSTLSIDKVGTGYTLTASSTGLTGATSAAFNVTAGAPYQLVFIAQPTDTRHLQPIQPAIKVAVEDAAGNIVTSSSAQIDISVLFDAKNHGSLSGTTSLSASNGVATFNDLVLNPPGTGYQLVASSGSLLSATSTPFDVSPN